MPDSNKLPVTVLSGFLGAGKTTVARHSPDDLVLNDDLVLLMPRDNRWFAYATPFTNPTQIAPRGPFCAPLALVCRLIQARQVSLVHMSPGAAMAEVLASVPLLATEPLYATQLLERIEALITAVPIYWLHFLPDSSFWDVVGA